MAAPDLSAPPPHLPDAAMRASPPTTHGPRPSFSKREGPSPAIHTYVLQSVLPADPTEDPSHAPCLALSPALPTSAAGSYAAVTPLFALTNLYPVMDIPQRLEIY